MIFEAAPPICEIAESSLHSISPDSVLIILTESELSRLIVGVICPPSIIGVVCPPVFVSSTISFVLVSAPTEGVVKKVAKSFCKFAMDKVQEAKSICSVDTFEMHALNLVRRSFNVNSMHLSQYQWTLGTLDFIVANDFVNFLSAHKRWNEDLHPSHEISFPSGLSHLPHAMINSSDVTATTI